MPQIQYSEKYYDDIYEYRCVRRVARVVVSARRWNRTARTNVLIDELGSLTRAQARGAPAGHREVAPEESIVV